MARVGDLWCYHGQSLSKPNLFSHLRAKVGRGKCGLRPMQLFLTGTRTRTRSKKKKRRRRQNKPHTYGSASVVCPFVHFRCPFVHFWMLLSYFLFHQAAVLKTICIDDLSTPLSYEFFGMLLSFFLFLSNPRTLKLSVQMHVIPSSVSHESLFRSASDLLPSVRLSIVEGTRLTMLSKVHYGASVPGVARQQNPRASSCPS